MSQKVISATRFFWAVQRSFEKLTPTTFRRVFVSRIRPTLKYGQPAVYPITKSESLMLKGVQWRGSKSVTGSWNIMYPKGLAQINMFSLGFRRVRGDLIYTWRILNGMFGEDVRGCFSKVSDSSNHGHRWKPFKQKRLRLDLCMVLSYRIVKLWNEVFEFTTKAEFQRRLKSYFRPRANNYCLMCNIQDPYRLEDAISYWQASGMI